MDCRQLKQLLLDGGDLASSEAKRHLADCPACRELAADGGALAHLLAAAGPARESAWVPAYADFESQLAGERRALQRLASLADPTRWLLASAALLIPVVVGFVLLRRDFAAYPTTRLLFEISGFWLPALAACWVWLYPLYRSRPPSWVVPLLFALGLLLPWLIAALPPTHAAAAFAGTFRALPRAPSCFIFGSALALPVAAMLEVLGRCNRGQTGFALLPALAAALAALVSLELHCANTSPSHLLAGHAPIAVVLPVIWQIGVMLMPRLTVKAWRRRRPLARLP